MKTKGGRSRTKGHNYERFIARWYRSIGLKARRGLQTRDGSEAADVQVEGLNVHIECKCHKTLGLAYRAYKQAEKSCKGKHPIVHLKGDYQGDYVFMSLETYKCLLWDAELLHSSNIGEEYDKTHPDFQNWRKKGVL